ncbi:FAD-binding Berberine family protein [Forsythia ovata]|uniref:FAD-binding Berberine family protein n=1 Tax=Forsythia ovata TaxID=205694 RepID=A0ABD1S0W3_9LAMI
MECRERVEDYSSLSYTSFQVHPQMYTWVVSGTPQTKKLQDILPQIIHQLGPDNLENLKKSVPEAANTCTKQYVHSRNSPIYSSLLQAAQQNPRWVNSITRKPLFIVAPTKVSEIQAAIVCSRENGLQIRVVSGGHDYEGLSYRCKTPFIVIDLVNYRSIDINLELQTAWVQAGATLGELYHKIAGRSDCHAFPAGLFPSVGVGGHISGGGLGTMVRKFGLAADNIVDATLIDANGKILDRNAMGDDVFWAIRGGGGASFGIIVSWKLKLVEVPSKVTVFSIDRFGKEARKLVHRWQYIADKLSEDLFIRVIIQNSKVNGIKTVKATFNSLFLGEADELIPLMSNAFPELDLKQENCIEMTWIQSVLYFAGFKDRKVIKVLSDRGTLYKSNFKGKSDFVQNPIPKIAFEEIWERFTKVESAFILMDPFGGRMDEIAEYELPFPHRQGNLFNIQYLVKWKRDGIRESKRHIEWIRDLYNYMTPYVTHSPRAAYFNYRDLDIGMNNQDNTSYLQAKIWGQKYFKGNFEKLVQVKTRFDPGNYFRNEQSIPLMNYA